MGFIPFHSLLLAAMWLSRMQLVVVKLLMGSRQSSTSFTVIHAKRMLYVADGLQQPEALERLECHILEQESEISNMENRACFALHCIQMETQLVYANMEVLSNVLQKMAEHERIFHSEVRVTPTSSQSNLPRRICEPQCNPVLPGAESPPQARRRSVQPCLHIRAA